jgi:thioredoxin reductase
MAFRNLPVVVIGAGPIGLAAASHLHEYNLDSVVFEAGDNVAASIRDWAHVRLFTPWRVNIDPASQRLLDRQGWEIPDLDAPPSGAELIEAYLEPLAATPELAGSIQTNHRVLAVAREGFDKAARTVGLQQSPFVVIVDTPAGLRRIHARAVIDASGTWTTPNPLGSSGIEVPGEREYAARVSYGIPDMLGRHRDRFAGKRVAVVGSGHSAQNVLLDLAVLRQSSPGTEITWVVRRDDMGMIFDVQPDDPLPARIELGFAVDRLVRDSLVSLVTGFHVSALEDYNDGLLLMSGDGRELDPVDEVIAATGFRPDLSLLKELRLALDPSFEAPERLSSLIDPKLHSCASVPLHGAAELAHPEPDVYVVGMKSYGRAPTFLLATGYNQVLSVVEKVSGIEGAASLHANMARSLENPASLDDDGKGSPCAPDACAPTTVKAARVSANAGCIPGGVGDESARDSGGGPPSCCG